MTDENADAAPAVEPKIQQVGEIQHRTIVEAKLAVMAEIQTLARTGFNTHHKFTFATVHQFYEMLRPLIVKHGLAHWYTQKAFVIDATINLNKAPLVMVTFEWAWQLLSDNGPPPVADRRELTFPMPLSDDKFAGKTLSYFLKYWFQSEFLINTEEDKEVDEGSSKPARITIDNKRTRGDAKRRDTRKAASGDAEQPVGTPSRFDHDLPAPRELFSVFQKDGKFTIDALPAVAEGDAFFEKQGGNREDGWWKYKSTAWLTVLGQVLVSPKLTNAVKDEVLASPKVVKAMSKLPQEQVRATLAQRVDTDTGEVVGGDGPPDGPPPSTEVQSEQFFGPVAEGPPEEDEIGPGSPPPEKPRTRKSRRKTDG